MKHLRLDAPIQTKHPPVFVVVLASLRAEGTPRLTLDLCKRWKEAGVETLVVVLFRSPAELAREFDAEAIPRVVLDWPATGFCRYLKLLWATFHLCRQNRATAVLSMPLGWHLFAAIGARMAGVRKVFAHVGNFPVPSPSRSWWKFKLEVQLGRPLTTYLVCCSEHVREGAIRAFGVRPEETVVIPNGIDLVSWASVAARRTLPTTGCLKLCMVATLEQHKDQETLIEAMPLLIERASAFGITVRLSLVGDGSRRGILEDRVAQLGVKDSVRFLGTQTNIASVLEQTDIFVFSTTEHEGQGIALVEAMAAGLPIVASDVGACRDVLRGGECGLLVPPRRPLELTEAILRVARDQKLAKTLSEAARARAQAEYSIGNTAERYARICGVEWTSA